MDIKVRRHAFRPLKRRMEDMDVDVKAVAKALGKKPCSVYERLQGRVSFTIDEAIIIATALNIPLNEIAYYFYRYPDKLPPREAEKKTSAERA